MSTLTGRILTIRRNAILGVAALALLSPAAAQAQAAQQAPEDTAPAPEDIIVTGTYLRSSTFQPSSPVDVVSAQTLQRQVQASVAGALAELPYVAGGAFGSGGGQSGSTINLRGLGAAATLVLLNGHRQARVPTTSSVVDVNTMVPEIMIGGIEILKDGASALYGTDAVAGVTNIRTRRDFSGLEFNLQGKWQLDPTTRTPELKRHPGTYRISAMWGAVTSDSSISVAIEHNRRDMVGYVGIPGDVATRYVPVPLPNQLTTTLRDASGVLRTGTGSTRTIVDPDCGSVPSTAVRGTSCLYSFYPDQTYLSDLKRTQIFLQAEHRFSDSLKFKVDAGYSKVDQASSQTASPSISVSPAFVLPGESPGVKAAGGGTLFRARDASGNLLFAQASASNPAVPARDANGKVIVTGTNAANGIPFWEDVTYAGRVITSQGGLPTGGTVQPGVFARSNPVHSTNDVLRISGGFEGKIANHWDWQAYLTYSSNEQSNGTNDILPNELRLALAGFGGANCNPQTGKAGVGPCQYFNPLIGSAFAAPGSGAANTQETIDFFFKEIQNHYKTELMVADAVVSGELFQLPAGPVGLAVGAQWRKEKWSVDFAANQENGNTANGTVNRDVAASGVTKSAFAELAVPIVDGPVGELKLNGALRYESTERSHTIDPKLGLLYTLPSKWLQLRASWGSSFLAPSLFQQFTQSTGLNNLTSTYGGTKAATAQPRVARIISGNPNLDPQQARSWNVGAVIRPVSGLRFSADYWHYKFKGLITEQNAQTLVNNDDLSLAAGTGPTGLVVRDSQGNVLQVKTQFFNASSLVTSGLDLQANYTTGLGNKGDLSLDANVTYVDKYDYTVSAGAPVLKAAGRWNDTNTSISPSVKWRGLFGARWTLGSHSVRATVNYTGPIANDRAVAGLAGDETFHAFTTVDLGYTYSLPQAFGLKDGSIAIGVSNLFNALPDTAGFEGHGVAFGLYDYQGRMAWARLVARY